jgi:electron transport complex protein RnfA
VVGGILALAFMGFTGVDSGLRKAMTPAQETAMVLPLESAHTAMIELNQGGMDR